MTESDPLIEKAKQLTQSTLRCIDAARDLLRRTDAIDTEVRELLKELERRQNAGR